jgi:catechol 2,3-dioxygenase-like lactoylglutathione lyase family enzyme
MTNNERLFSGGRNIALKIPPHEFDQTLRFYRDTLGLRQLDNHLPSHVFEFGANLLWLDRSDTMTHTEIWLELRTPDTNSAAARLEINGVARCDAIEHLPEGFDGFWITSPGNIVHLVHGPQQDI